MKGVNYQNELNTNARHDRYLSLMAPFGTIYPLTISTDNLIVPFLPFLLKDISIRGSTMASRAIYAQMLDFVDRHKVKPILERFPFTKEGLQKAIGKLEKGEVRYRAIFDLHDQNS